MLVLREKRAPVPLGLDYSCWVEEEEWSGQKMILRIALATNAVGPMKPESEHFWKEPTKSLQKNECSMRFGNAQSDKPFKEESYEAFQRYSGRTGF